MDVISSPVPYKEKAMTQFQESHITLKQALNYTYKVDQLKSLAKKISKKNPIRKAEIVDHIVQIMFNDLKDIITKLNPMIINAIAEAVHNWGGFYKSEQFYAKYNAYPTENSGKSQKESSLFYLFFVDGVIPYDLLERLKEFINVPKDEKIQYSNSSDAEGLTFRDTANAALINLHTLLTMVKEKKIRVSNKTGRATAATIKAITAILYDGDYYEDEEIGPIQAFAWPLLLQGGGLAIIDGNYLILTKKGNTALKKDLAMGIKTIWTKWEKTKIIDEYSRVKIVKGQNSAKGRTMTSPVWRRPVINSALSMLAVGKWVKIDELARFMRSKSLTFEMTNYDWKLYLSDPHYGLLDYYDTWPLLQFRYLLTYFFEYCATLGLLDVGFKEPYNARNDFDSCWGVDDERFFSTSDGLMKIRLNDLGAYALDLTTEYTPQGTQKFKRVDTDIFYTGDGIPLPDISIYLDKIAEQKDVHIWHISLTSLISAIKAGETLKEIMHFIKKITSEKPDKSLLNLFNEVENLSTAIIEKGSVTLLECRSQIRKQILMDKNLHKLCLPAGDQHIIILPGKNEFFIRHLEAMGIIIGS